MSPTKEAACRGEKAEVDRLFGAAADLAQRERRWTMSMDWYTRHSTSSTFCAVVRVEKEA